MKVWTTSKVEVITGLFGENTIYGHFVFTHKEIQALSQRQDARLYGL